MKSGATLSPQANRQVIMAGVILFLVFSLLAAINAEWKLLGISWIAFLSMACAIPLGIRSARSDNLNRIIAGYGIASGAMITSAAIFLIPAAINHNPTYGGVGIALGIITGFAIHTLNHGLSHSGIPVDSVVVELTSHALTAGLIIGIVYVAMPDLSLLLGIAIVSHKGPAGYAAAGRLAKKKSAPWLILLPACALGITALPVSLLNPPGYPIINALIFGFATGIFFHVAIDFLPECEVGGQLYQQVKTNELDHATLDTHRKWAVFSTFLGALIVFLLWFVSS